MKIPEVIEKTSRKTLRYVLFQAKRIFQEGGEKIDPQILGLTAAEVESIERYFVDKEHPLKGFSVQWDIGLDDTFIMANRPEKYWLFGIRKHVRVKRPVEKITLLTEEGVLEDHMRSWRDSADEGRRFFAREGYVIRYGDNPNDFDIDYDKIMREADSRTTWLKGERQWR
jgi:hypothetical protein